MKQHLSFSFLACLIACTPATTPAPAVPVDAADSTGGPVIAAPLVPAVAPKCDALAAAKLVFGPKAERIDPKGDLRLLSLLCDLAAQPAAERKCQVSAVDAVFSCAVECVTIATVADGGPACMCHGSPAGDYGCNVKS